MIFCASCNSCRRWPGGADASECDDCGGWIPGVEDGLPPKSSIAYVKVNPDLYAAEYQEPPFDGARVEIYTEARTEAPTHGALFMTNSSPG